jgi:hypothetical protein
MTDESTDARLARLEEESAGLRRQVEEHRAFLRQQGELNRKLAAAIVKSAESAALINDNQQRIARQQELLYLILGAKLFPGAQGLKTLLDAIAANPETPTPFAEAAAGLRDSVTRSTPGHERPRWIPEIVGGTDLEQPH